MKLIDPSYEILEQEPGIAGMFKQIERAGRTCYKSEDKITADSARGFVERMIASNHTAMLEHGTCYLYWRHAYSEDGESIISTVDEGDPFDVYLNFMMNEHSVHNTDFITHESFVTTNFRVVYDILGDNWEEFLKTHMVDYDNRFIRRPTVKLTTSLHVYKDLTRHRKASFAIESTRFCNYSKGKFDNELTFIKPIWCDTDNNPTYLTFTETLEAIEKAYLSLTDNGWQAQQAAEILPQCIKADVVITADINEWKHIFDLRAKGTTGDPHPEVKRIIEPIMADFIDKSWIKDE